MALECDQTKQRCLDDTKLKEMLFYEGRIQTYIILENQNENLRELMKMLIYSSGCRFGLNDDNDFIES